MKLFKKNAREDQNERETEEKQRKKQKHKQEKREQTDEQKNKNQITRNIKLSSKSQISAHETIFLRKKKPNTTQDYKQMQFNKPLKYQNQILISP